MNTIRTPASGNPSLYLKLQVPNKFKPVESVLIANIGTVIIAIHANECIVNDSFLLIFKTYDMDILKNMQNTTL